VTFFGYLKLNQLKRVVVSVGFIFILNPGLTFGQIGQSTESKKTYIVDEAKSKVEFEIKAECRLLPGGYVVVGTFSKLGGKISYDAIDFSASGAQIETQISSLTTVSKDAHGCAKVMPDDGKTRDTHLMSEEFFDQKVFSTARFKSIGRIEPDGDNTFRLRGKLTIKEIPQIVQLKLRPKNQYKDSNNREHLVFEAQTTIDRNSFAVGPSSGEIKGLGSLLISVANELQLTILIDAFEVAP